MDAKEALIRVKTGSFNSGHGFDVQLLIDAVGTIREMFKSGQIREVVLCKDCKYLIDHYGFMDDGYCKKKREGYNAKLKPKKDWYCADGERRDDNG